MKPVNPPKKIILAVDLKAADPSLTQRVWKAVKPLIGEETIVEPVTILNREDLAIANALKNQIGKLRTATEHHLKEQLKGLGLKNLAPPKVLFADGSSTQRAVLALLNYAHKSKVDLIAVSSHSRKGVKRLFLGSFAESLSLQSSIPLLVVNPSQRETGSSNRILFPTDFSPESLKGLEKVCASFQGAQTKIVLFHTYLFPPQIYLEPFSSYPISQSILKEEYKRAEAIANQWCAKVKNKGISCEVLIDRKARFIADGILAAIKTKKIDMVAMVSSTGKIGAMIVGSSTREVLRSSTRPVWVIHPGKAPAKKVVPLKKVASTSTPKSSPRKVVGWR